MHISVIVPTYKPKEYLWECLDSLADQTFPKDDFEVILILNGCKEPYESEIKNYLVNKNLLNVRLIQINQPGVSNARNMGLDRAKGEYITFIDDDDYVSTTYLEELYSKASPTTIVIANSVGIRNEKIFDSYTMSLEFKKNSPNGKQNFQRSRKYFQGPCMKLFHKDIISKRRFDRRFKNGEDSLFMFLISDKFKYVDYTSRNAIYYRRIRLDGANYKKRSYMIKLVNTMKMIGYYSRVYFKDIENYSFLFFLTRVLGAIKSIFV